jgi:soluble lytic murein transglycosylase
MRDQQLAITALAAFGLLGMWSGVTSAHTPAPTRAEPAHVAVLPEVVSPTPAARPELARVEAQLERYRRRTGLTRRERSELAECIVTEAKRHQLEPSLVLAVMHIESLYDTFAVSDKDAMGLMQLLPSTGEWLAPQVGVEWRGPQSLFDPIVNVRLGVAYLRQLADRYEGDIATALAAYNWGPGRIDSKLRRGVLLPTGYAHSVLAALDAKTATRS